MNRLFSVLEGRIDIELMGSNEHKQFVCIETLLKPIALKPYFDLYS